MKVTLAFIPRAQERSEWVPICAAFALAIALFSLIVTVTAASLGWVGTGDGIGAALCLSSEKMH
jgi:hypothetical protein